jgi:hypothetical protein
MSQVEQADLLVEERLQDMGWLCCRKSAATRRNRQWQMTLRLN